jgi:hypothetical protein
MELKKKEMYWRQGFESHNAALAHRFNSCYCTIPVAFEGY